jgi:hypothetical protein
MVKQTIHIKVVAVSAALGCKTVNAAYILLSPWQFSSQNSPD